MIDGRENATVAIGSDLNFRFRMLLKGAVISVDDVCPESDRGSLNMCIGNIVLFRFSL